MPHLMLFLFLSIYLLLCFARFMFSAFEMVIILLLSLLFWLLLKLKATSEGFELCSSYCLSFFLDL